MKKKETIGLTKAQRKPEENNTEEIEFDISEADAAKINQIAELSGISFDDVVRVVIAMELIKSGKVE